MNVSEWIVAIKKCKKSVRYSSNLFGGKLFSTLDGFKLQHEDECKTCKHVVGRTLLVTFDKDKCPEHLSQFQVSTLWCVFVLGILPHDYAAYHKCIAGREFIVNIKTISVVGGKV